MHTPKIVVTDELKRTLEAIDACKERIHAEPAPPEEVLQRLEKEFIVDTVYHATRIEGSMLTKAETEKTLYPET